jgi:T5SS/PEP-CTERM-associated repeat protein/autotransporter-associated beta strand protein
MRKLVGGDVAVAAPVVGTTARTNHASLRREKSRSTRARLGAWLRSSTFLASGPIALAAVLAATSLPAQAQSVWNGTLSTNWFTGGNWTPAGAPGAADDATIDTITPNAPVVGGGAGLAEAAVLTVGLNNTGITLTVQDARLLRTVNGLIGFNAASSGTVTVTGGNSRWENSTDMWVGVDGTGTLNIQNSGRVETLRASVGLSAGSTGIVNVNSGGSWTITNALQVGHQGNGTLNIQNGTVNTAFGSIGESAGSIGTATVSGTGVWTDTTVFVVGRSGTGTLTIQNGGTVNSAFGGIGNAVGGTGTATVTGTGSTWNSSDEILIASFGTGTLTVANGGTVSAVNQVRIAGQAGSVGTLNIGAAAADPAAAPGTLTTPTVAFGAGTGTINFNHTASNYVFAPQITGLGTVNVLAGTTVFTGASTYIGPTTVNGGALIVNGSIVSATTVNSGGRLGGSGSVGNVTVNSGGTLAPGPVGAPGTMTVNGSLAFQSSTTYLVQVSGANASRTNVTGSAALNGTVQAQFAPGNIATSYTILSATGGLGGTTFQGVTTPGQNFTASLSYTPTNVILNLTAALGNASGLNQNQQNVAGAINGFFNNGGTLPPGFQNLFNLTGASLANALSQVSGEVATGAQQSAFQLTSQFLGVMLDPFVNGRGSIVNPSGGAAMGYVPEKELPPELAEIYAADLGVVPAKSPVPTYAPRWAVWGAGYGGQNNTNGSPQVGSRDLTARAVGVAAGLDYRVGPGTTVGFAMAGGGTDWRLTDALGRGRSDAVQAGLYSTTRMGPAYIAAALAYTNHWMSTDRFAFAGNHLTAKFNGQSLGARVEGGWRVGIFSGGVTPYAAGQGQALRTPSYVENDLNNGGFGLAYEARTATALRGELGTRFDQSFAIASGVTLGLYGRLAYAYDWVSDPSLNPVFQALPGAGFIVNGATPAQHLALASIGTELKLANFSIATKFDGEFASGSATYSGTGTVRVAW